MILVGASAARCACALLPLSGSCVGVKFCQISLIGSVLSRWTSFSRRVFLSCAQGCHRSTTRSSWKPRFHKRCRCSRIVVRTASGIRSRLWPILAVSYLPQLRHRYVTRRCALHGDIARCSRILQCAESSSDHAMKPLCSAISSRQMCRALRLSHSVILRRQSLPCQSQLICSQTMRRCHA